MQVFSSKQYLKEILSPAFFQVEMITTASMKAGFTGGLVVDYPNSSKVLMSSLQPVLNVITGEEVLPCADDWWGSTVASGAWRRDKCI